VSDTSVSDYTDASHLGLRYRVVLALLIRLGLHFDLLKSPYQFPI
jgi:hypothetical protein